MISNAGDAYEPDTWTTQDVQLTFSAQDNEDGSGIKDIRFSATGAQSIPETVYNSYNSPVINTEGTTTISYFATDNVGNQESPAKTFTVKLDKTPPAASIMASASSSRTAIGFSTSTCEPASRQSMAMRAWNGCGARITQTSGSMSASISR
jgi:hypothetical protein